MKDTLDLFGGIDPPGEQLKPTYINVNGRKEHEKIIKDAAKCAELGLDQYFEVMGYMKRWGGYLNETEST